MIRIITLIVIALALAGCSVNKQFAQASDANATQILPDWVKRINADPKLSKTTKEIRTRTAKKWFEMIDKALKRKLTPDQLKARWK